MKQRALSVAGALMVLAPSASHAGHADTVAVNAGSATPAATAAATVPASAPASVTASLPAPTSVPSATPTTPAPTSAIALDGDARGYERAPTEATDAADTVVGGVGTGLSYVARGVFFPLRGAIAAEQRWQISRRIDHLLWNDAHTFGIVPAASFSFDSGATIGARAVYRDFLGHGEQVSLGADTGGAVVQAYQLAFELPALGPFDLAGRVRYEDNDHLRFQGIGNGEVMDDDDVMLGANLDPRAAAVETRFAQRRVLSTLRAGVHHGGFRAGASAIFNDRTFRAVDDDSIEEVYDTSRITGYDDGITTVELGVDVGYDGRDSLHSSGGVARAFAGAVPGDNAYAHYGGQLEYHLAPSLPGRVLGARLALEGVRPFDGDGDGEVPFTELPRLGGGSMLRGYSSGQFRDRLATVATLEYRYPIHANLSGELFVEAGKVARTYDELVGKHDWHGAVGGGLLLHTRSRLKLRADVAYGDGFQLFLGTDVLDAFRAREREL